MLVWLNRQEAETTISADDDDEWFLHKPEVSWRIWKLLESMDWKFLPVQGGLLDQPDWLMEDLTTINIRRFVMKQLKNNSAGM